MDALALVFIVLPFALLGGLFFVALVNYELTPRIAALPDHQRMALLIWGGWSLIVGLDVGSTHYGIPGAVGAFCLTFFAVPLLFVATGYAVGFLMEQRTTVREILNADDGIGLFLAWVSLPACGFLFFGDGDPGTLSVAFWAVGVGAYFVSLWFIGAVYGACKVLDLIDETGNGFQVPGWWPVRRSSLVSLRAQLASVRCQRDEAHAQSVENYNRAIFAERLLSNAERQLISQAALQSKIRDLQSERRRAWEAKDAHEMDAEGWRAEVEAAKFLHAVELDGLREEYQEAIDVLTAQLDQADSDLMRMTLAVEGVDLGAEVERSERITRQIASFRDQFDAVRAYLTPGQVHEFRRVVEALER